MKNIEALMFVKGSGPLGATAVLNDSELSTRRFLRKTILATEDYFLTIGLRSMIIGEETDDDWRVLALCKSAIRINPLNGEISCDEVFVVTENGVHPDWTIAKFSVTQIGKHGFAWYLFPEIPGL